MYSSSPKSSPADRFSKAFERYESTSDNDCSKEMENILQEMTEDCENGKIEYLMNPTNTIFFDQLYKVLSEARGSEQEPVMLLGSSLKAVFTFVSQAALYKQIRQILTDTYGMMNFVASFIHRELRERRLLINIMELLSRDLVLTWKLPYMTVLVGKASHILLELDILKDDLEMLTIIQFFVNICRHNSFCITIVRNNEYCKFVLRNIADDLSNSDIEYDDHPRMYRIQVVFSHWLYLICPDIPTDNFHSGYELLKNGSARLLKDRKLELLTRAEYIVSLGMNLIEFPASLNELADLITTIIEKIKPLFIETGSDKCGKSKATLIDYINLMLQELNDFVSAVEDIPVGDCIAVLKLTLALYPLFLTGEHLSRGCAVGLNIGRLAMTKMEINGNAGEYVPVLALTIFQRIVELLLEDKLHNLQGDIYKHMDDTLMQSLDIFNFSTELNSNSITLNTLLARLICSLANHPRLRSQVAYKFSHEAIHKFTNNLTELESASRNTMENLDQAVCIVEVLCAIGQFTNIPAMPDLFMKLISKQTVCDQIAYCIHNGDERATTKALSIVGAAPFDRNKLKLITNSLIIMREKLLPVSRIIGNDFSSASVVGTSGLASSIALVETSIQNATNPGDLKFLFSDIMSWYKIKDDLGRLEIGNLQEQLHHLSKANLQLKILLERQMELVSKRVNHTEKESMDVITLQNRLHDVSQELKSKTGQLYKELNILKVSYNEARAEAEIYKEDLLKEKAVHQHLKESFNALQNEKEVLSKKMINEYDEKRAWRNSSNKYKSNLTEANAKLAKLEEELKQKEEERANAVMILEKERKMLDTIRGLVGNNFGNLNLS